MDQVPKRIVKQRRKGISIIFKRKKTEQAIGEILEERGYKMNDSYQLEIVDGKTDYGFNTTVNITSTNVHTINTIYDLFCGLDKGKRKTDKSILKVTDIFPLT